MMNILQVVPEFNVGGVETGTLDLANYLVKQGHKAVVVSSGGALVKDLESFGGIHYSLSVHNKSILTMLRMVPRLIGIIRKEKIEIVHARSRVPAWIAYAASRLTGTAFITTCHGYYKKHPFSYIMGWAKRVIVPSNVIARHMIDDFGVPHERIRLIARSVDLERFTYRTPHRKLKGDFNVGIVGRLTPIKGHMDFIKAMALVLRSIPNLKVWIVGDAPASKANYKEQLQVLTKRLGLWHCTQFLGNQKDIPAIMSSLDLLVLPTTTHEAFGRVLVEAQASGVAVVATRVGGVVDIVEDEKTGLLVPPADPRSIASAVIRLFNDEKLRIQLVEGAYEKVKEKYDAQLMCQKTLDVYRQALQQRKFLLIKLSSLGDAILSTAAIRAIREKFPHPQHNLSCLVAEEAKDVLLGCPYIDELIVCDFKYKDRGLRGLLHLGATLRKQNYDSVIDLQNNRRSHLIAFLTLTQERYGYDNHKFGFLLNKRIKDDKAAIDPLSHQFRVLKMLGIELKNPQLELWPSKDDEAYVTELLGAEWLSAQQKIIGINMSASSRWLTKSWPLENIAKLCEALSSRQMRILLTGTQGDLGQVDILMGMLKNVKPINTCGKTTVNQLACLIKKCSAYVSADSAPLHIAASVGVPFVALFGPTDPNRHLPPVKKCAVIKKDLSCRPCYKSKCKTKKCMDLITPQEVLEAINTLLT